MYTTVRQSVRRLFARKDGRKRKKAVESDLRKQQTLVNQW